MDIRRRILMQIGGKEKMVEIGTYTPDIDVAANSLHIPHILGVVPDFVMVIADEFAATTDMTVRYIANAYCAKANLIASNKTTNGFAAYQASWNDRDMQWSTVEAVNYTKFLYEDYFIVPYYSSIDFLKAGITYHYVVGKFE